MSSGWLHLAFSSRHVSVPSAAVSALPHPLCLTLRASQFGLISNNFVFPPPRPFCVLPPLTFTPRETHHISGAAVKMAEDRGVPLSALSVADLQSIHPDFADDVVKVG